MAAAHLRLLTHAAALLCATTLAVACTAEPPTDTRPRPPAPPEAVVTPAPAPIRWVQRGEATPDEARMPFSGAAEVLAACEGAPPCQAERWVPVDGLGPGQEALVLLHRGDRVAVHAGPTTGPWRSHWQSLSGALGGCVGDPLGRPVARDPAAARVLLEGETGWSWQLSLSGGGPCQLTGLLTLDARADRTDATAVRCGERPWMKGGRACAEGRLRDWLRDTALARWDGLDLAEQALLLELLLDDPEAEAVLEGLEARGVALPARSHSD